MLALYTVFMHALWLEQRGCLDSSRVFPEFRNLFIEFYRDSLILLGFPFGISPEILQRIFSRILSRISLWISSGIASLISPWINYSIRSGGLFGNSSKNFIGIL